MEKTEYKIKYINDKLYYNTFYNNIILKTIVDNNIIYTENKNGKFVNLSKLNKDQINIIYNSIENDTIYDCENNRNNILKNYKKEFNKINKKTKVKITYKNYKELNNIDKLIIDYSKTI